MSLQTCSIIMFSVFIVFLLAISFWAYYKNKTGTSGADVEYYLGGKTIPVFVLAFSYVVSANSASCYMGEPGAMSVVGWPYYWVVIAFIPGMIIPAVFLMRKMRAQAEKLGSLTVPEYLGNRYDSNALRVIVASLVVLLYITVLIAQFKGSAILMEMFLGIPYNAGVMLTVVIMVVFVAIGGLRSVAWTDFVQGIPMIIIALILVFISFRAVGGFSGLETMLAAYDPDMLRIVEAEEPGAIMPLSGVIGNFVFYAVIFISQPYLCSRFLAVRNIEKKTIASFLVITLIVTAVIELFYLVGLTGRVLYPDAEADYLTVTMAIDMLPTAVAAFMMVGIFAAIMSTVTSIMLVMSQSIGRDIYALTIKKNATSQEVVRVTRWAVVGIAVVACFFTYAKPPQLLTILMYLGMSGIGSCVGIPLYAGILSNRATRQGALAAAISGPVVYGSTYLLLGINFWFACMIGIAVAIVFMVTISIYVNKKNDRLQAAN